MSSAMHFASSTFQPQLAAFYFRRPRLAAFASSALAFRLSDLIQLLLLRIESILTGLVPLGSQASGDSIGVKAFQVGALSGDSLDSDVEA